VFACASVRDCRRAEEAESGTVAITHVFAGLPVADYAAAYDGMRGFSAEPLTCPRMTVRPCGG